MQEETTERDVVPHEILVRRCVKAIDVLFPEAPFGRVDAGDENEIGQAIGNLYLRASLTAMYVDNEFVDSQPVLHNIESVLEENFKVAPAEGRIRLMSHISSLYNCAIHALHGLAEDGTIEKDLLKQVDEKNTEILGIWQKFKHAFSDLDGSDRPNFSCVGGTGCVRCGG